MNVSASTLNSQNGVEVRGYGVERENPSTLNFQFSILNFQFSTFNSQLSILNSQLSILNFQFSTLHLLHNHPKHFLTFLP